MTTPHTIAVFGGTGKEGKGLALRWAAKGHEIVIGSRAAERAQAAADDIARALGGKARVRGADNLDAAQACTIAVLCVPYAGQIETASAIASEKLACALGASSLSLASSSGERRQCRPEGIERGT